MVCRFRSLLQTGDRGFRLWENSGVQGAYSAPTARDVIVAYFDKKQRRAEEEARKQQKMDAPKSLVSAIAPPIPAAPEIRQ